MRKNKTKADAGRSVTNSAVTSPDATGTLPVAKAPTKIAPNATRKGRVQMVDTRDIVVGKRYRNDLGDVTDLAHSIDLHGLIDPITVDEDMTLISGYRRLKAFEKLRQSKIPCYVVRLDDAATAGLDADRCRHPLDALAKYDWAEALRERLTDEAWARKRFGKRAVDAQAKGRVDDLLARHVGVSRPTLVKVRKIVEAATAEPAMYGDILTSMKIEPNKVDRHYKQLMSRTRTAAGPDKTVKAIMLDPDWQAAFDSDPKLAMATITQLEASSKVEDGGVAIVPTSLAHLKDAVQAMNRLGASWVDSYVGTHADTAVWLIGVFGKAGTVPADLMTNLPDACECGCEFVSAALTEWDGNSRIKSSLAATAEVAVGIAA